MLKFTLEVIEYKVEFEGPNLIYFHCGQFGHKMDVCPIENEKVVNQGGGSGSGENLKSRDP